MNAIVRCPTCHREESWDLSSPSLRVAVVQAGGNRRPDVDPQWARGRTALACVEGGASHVVGVCSACGQLLTSDDGRLPAIDVPVNTPQGTVTVGADGAVTGPSGAMSVAQAGEFLSRQYAVPWTRGLAGDMARSSLFVVLVPIALMWLGALLIVFTMLMALWEGPPAAISNIPQPPLR